MSEAAVGAGEAPRGTLYVIGTPIGNLEDLSPRAVTALAQSRLIACEDTRRTRAIMARHGLTTRLVSCHKFNESRRAGEVLKALAQGASVALVSDGGTPGVSDPGALLVRRARADGHRVVPIPGASAVTALLSVSGVPSGPFTFIGFLPHRRGERRRTLEALRLERRPLLFFESPRRVGATLQDALEILGDREICLGREMTKIHEEFLCGSLRIVRDALAGRALKGEISFLLTGADDGSLREARDRVGAADPSIARSGTVPAESPAESVRRLVRGGMDRKEAMRRVARERGLPRRVVYKDLLRDRGEEE
ncbi:MAG TPA: 16S rRNA (cytidine(1402)-2'-O)-methyltransferase [Candidatus Polarisedimenticolia bacterium]|nr:16S rRNA (cytidine(1402)-2'-O)-methyltransferase [Candidatus Polarisedimenticolia bacterium]